MAPVKAASASPFCGAKLADAAAKDPGCNHTSTGADEGKGLGVHTFNLRQSSLPDGSPVTELS